MFWVKSVLAIVPVPEINFLVFMVTDSALGTASRLAASLSIGHSNKIYGRSSRNSQLFSVSFTVTVTSGDHQRRHVNTKKISQDLNDCVDQVVVVAGNVSLL